MTHANTLVALSSVQAALETELRTISIDGKGIKVYGYDPGMPDALPCLVLNLPDLDFPDVDESQSVMGAYDVEFTYPLTIYINAQNLTYAHTTAIKSMSGIVDAIEAVQTLDGNVEDIRVTSMRPSFVFDVNGGNPKLVVECQLHGLLFIANN